MRREGSDCLILQETPVEDSLQMSISDMSSSGSSTFIRLEPLPERKITRTDSQRRKSLIVTESELEQHSRHSPFEKLEQFLKSDAVLDTPKKRRGRKKKKKHDDTSRLFESDSNLSFHMEDDNAEHEDNLKSVDSASRMGKSESNLYFDFEPDDEEEEQQQNLEQEKERLRLLSSSSKSSKTKMISRRSSIANITTSSKSSHHDPCESSRKGRKEEPTVLDLSSPKKEKKSKTKTPRRSSIAVTSAQQFELEQIKQREKEREQLPASPTQPTNRRDLLVRNQSWNPSSPKKKSTNRQDLLQKQLSERSNHFPCPDLEQQLYDDASEGGHMDRRGMFRRRGSILIAKHPEPVDPQEAEQVHGVASQPISLYQLLCQTDSKKLRLATSKTGGRHESGGLKQRPRSCFAPQGVSFRRPALKHVRFATNSNTDHVWSLVRTFHKVPASIHNQIWWSEFDLDKRYYADNKLVDLMEAPYSVLVKSTFERCCKLADADCDSSCRDLKVNALEMSKCSILRGLEVETCPRIRQHRKQHRAAILDNQDVYSVDRLRIRSLHFSQASTLLATKMAELDHGMAIV